MTWRGDYALAQVVMMHRKRTRTRRLGAAAGIGFAFGALAVPNLAAAATDDSDYPPDETVATTTTTTVFTTPTTIPSTGNDNLGEMLATGAAFGVAGLGMIVVARRRRQPA